MEVVTKTVRHRGDHDRHACVTFVHAGHDILRRSATSHVQCMSQQGAVSPSDVHRFVLSGQAGIISFHETFLERELPHMGDDGGAALESRLGRSTDWWPDIQHLEGQATSDD